MAASTDQLASSRAEVSGREYPWVDTVFRGLALAGFPASLTSPGATVSMALVAAYGLWLLVKWRDVAPDIRQVIRFMAVCYVIVLAADFANGGGLGNITSTGVNYLPLIALAPYAHALRSMNLTRAHFDRAMQVTILLAVAYALVNSAILGQHRPGGINLNPIPYAFVIAMWAVFQFSRALENKKIVNWAMLVALSSVIPIAISGSKISLLCFFVGFVFVGAYWVFEKRSRLALLAGAVALSTVVTLTYLLGGFRRWESLVEEIAHFLQTGLLRNASLGQRVEMTTAGWKAFLEKPFLGHGLIERMDAGYAYARVGGPDILTLGHYHNDYITHLVSYGILGAIFLTLFFLFVFSTARAAPDPTYRRATFALLLMLAIYMCFEIVFNMDPMSGAVTIALGMVICCQREGRASGNEAGDAVYENGTNDA